MYRTLLVLLLLLHLFADFYMQTEKLAEKKKEYWGSLLLHCLFYFIVVAIGTVAFYGTKSAFWLALAVSVFHLAIDTGKFCYQNYHKRRSPQKEKQLLAFVYSIDQCLHFLTILLVALITKKGNMPFPIAPYILHYTNMISVDILSLLKWFFLALFIWQPANITIYKLLSQYKAEKVTAPAKDAEITDFTGNANTISITVQLSESSPVKAAEATLEANAGKLIGTLERAIIALLLLVNQYAAIGLVLTAKSVARYEKLKEKNFAEYYLLGTLLSTLLVIAAYLFLFIILKVPEPK